FVDIGVHQDGLVHISEMADRFVKNPADVVKVHQKVKVTVMEVDMERKRISLSMKSVPGEGRQKASPVRKKKGKKAANTPKPFNNPFAEAFVRNK
ncbi:MAG: RNA-binding transcriptional accessory protein, partial [Deltaproteobacteria bacterium]